MPRRQNLQKIMKSSPASPSDSQLEAQRQVLEMVVRGRPLTEVLDALRDIARTQLANVAKLDIRLTGESGPAPNDCGTWSTPVCSTDGRMLGAVTITLDDGQSPEPAVCRLTEFVAHT